MKLFSSFIYAPCYTLAMLHQFMRIDSEPDPQLGSRDSGAVKIFTNLLSLCIYLFWVNFIMAMSHLKYILFSHASE